MATTEFIEEDFGIFAIATRTDESATELDDLSAEEARTIFELFTDGFVGHQNAFRVVHTNGMNIEIGSGLAKNDLYLVPSTAQGRGKYLVRLEPSVVPVVVPAAEASSTRTDEVYIVVTDGNYDGGTLHLPRLAYRRGDPGGANPGPDGSWGAYALLARVPVGPGANTPGTVSDQRKRAGLVTSLGGGVPIGGIIAWSGSIANIPVGWRLCDGGGGTPNLRNRFIVGAGGNYNPNATGGVDTVTLTVGQMPSHSHGSATHNHGSGSLSGGSSGSSHIHDGLSMEGSGSPIRLGISDGSNEETQSGTVRIPLERGIRMNRRPTGGLNANGGRVTVFGVGPVNSGHTHPILGSTQSVKPNNTSNVGGGSAHENRPPYLALAFIMRVS